MDRGVGAVLVIVVVMLLVLFVMGIFQGFFSSHLVDRATRSSRGNIALALADSGEEEAFYAIQRDVNVAGTSLHEAMRMEVAGVGDDGFEIQLPLLPILENDLLSRPSFRPYELVRASAEYLLRRPLHGLTYETVGLLRTSARIRTRISPHIVRQVDVYRDVRVALVSPPRPFDQVSLFVGDPESLLGRSIESANQDIRKVFQHIQTELVGKRLDRLDSLLNEAAGYGSQLGEWSSVVSTLRQKLQAARTTVSAYVPQDINRPPRNEVEHPHYFGNPLFLISTADIDDLKEIVLTERLARSTEKEQQAEQLYEAAQQELSSYLDSTSEPSPSEVERLMTRSIDRLEAAGAAYKARLEIYREFQARFYEKSGRSYQSWARNFLPKLSPARWSSRAMYHVEAEPGFSADEKLQALRNRLGGVLNGIVWVRGGEVTLSGAWRGRTVIASSGPIRCKDLVTPDPSRDQITLYSNKGIVLEGSRTDAALMLGPSAGLTIDPGISIQGHIVFTGRVTQPDQLQGKLAYNPLLFSGNSDQVPPDLSHLMVAISPQIRARAIHRK